MSIVAVNGSSELTEAVRHFHRFAGDGVVVEPFVECARLAAPSDVVFLVVELEAEAGTTNPFRRALKARSAVGQLTATPMILVTARPSDYQRLVLADAELTTTLTAPFDGGAYLKLAGEMSAFVRTNGKLLAQRRSLAEALARREFAASLAILPQLGPLYAEPARHLGRLRVEVLMAAGDAPAALAAARAAVAGARYSLRAHELLLAIYEAAGTPADYLRAAAVALEVAPTHPFFMAALGHTKLAAGALPEAAKAYVDALAREPGLVDARRGLIAVRLAEGRGRAADAEVPLQKGDPGFVRFASARAEALTRGGHIEPACRLLAGACELFASKVVPHTVLLQLAKLYHESGDNAKALDAVRRCKAQAPASFEIPAQLLRKLTNRAS